jgi:hypothetical protein
LSPIKGEFIAWAPEIQYLVDIAGPIGTAPIFLGIWCPLLAVVLSLGEERAMASKVAITPGFEGN